MSATEINTPAQADNIGLLKSQDDIQCNASLSSFSGAATVCKDRSVVPSLHFTQLLDVCHQVHIPLAPYCAICMQTCC